MHLIAIGSSHSVEARQLIVKAGNKKMCELFSVVSCSVYVNLELSEAHLLGVESNALHKAEHNATALFNTAYEYSEVVIHFE